MAVLSVNVNKVAVLRNSRGGECPDVVRAARTCLEAGAAGITVHPRPDARHIRAADVMALAALCRAHGVELNLEGNPSAPPREGYPGFHALCAQAQPAQATLVPDGDAQLTSDHGFDFLRDGDGLRPHVAALKAIGCRVSLFCDVADAQTDDDALAARMAAAADTGAARVELYTGPYAQAHADGDVAAALADCRRSADAASAAGLGVNAGHDLSQANLAALLEAVPALAEVSIGHALIDEALYAGLDATVRAYLRLLDASP